MFKGYGTGSALLKLTSAGNNKVSMEEVYFLEAKTLQNKHGGMVLVNGHIYCGHGNGSGLPICVDIKTGAVAWGARTRRRSGESSVTYADGHVVFRFQDGKIAIVKANSEKFEVIRSFDPAFQEKNPGPIRHCRWPTLPSRTKQSHVLSVAISQTWRRSLFTMHFIELF